MQINAEMGGEGGSQERRDILRGTSFYGLSAETYMTDLQFLQRCEYRFTSSGVRSCVTLLLVRDVSKKCSSVIPKVQGIQILDTLTLEASRARRPESSYSMRSRKKLRCYVQG